MPVHRLRNPVKHYDWGSRTALPELLGEPSPSDEPWAELWAGAHARGSSEILVDGVWQSLREWIAADPPGALGADVAARHGELPFLLKILASEQPLSLQTHPDPAEARAGFEREEAAGVELTARHRSFPDPNPKPELVVALERFEVLCGVRPLPEIERALAQLAAPAVSEHMREGVAEGAPLGLLKRWLATPRDVAERLAAEASEAAERAKLSDPGLAWIPRLAATYPGDIGVLAPLFLTYRALSEGEGLFVGAGVLHGYLRGTALELQASSDNVLRGGLTQKHIDLELLFGTLRPEMRPEASSPAALSGAVREWPVDTDRFSLRSLQIDGDTLHCPVDRGAEIVLCTAGQTEIGDDEGALPLAPGSAAFVPGSAKTFWIRGTGTVHRASAA